MRPMLELRLQAPEGADEEEIERLGRELRSTVLESDVASAEFPRRPGSTDDAKPGDVVSWTEVLVTLGASGGVVTSLIALLQSFAGRNRGASVHVKYGDRELSITGASDEEKDELIREFVEGAGASVD